MLAPCEGKLTVNQNKPTQPSPLPLSASPAAVLALFVCDQQNDSSERSDTSEPTPGHSFCVTHAI